VSLDRLVDESRASDGPSPACAGTLAVARSGFYDWQRHPLSDRALTH